jgi:hypothetical protein
MSSTFSFSRLGKLINKQLFENARLYTFSVLALFGLLALIFAFYIAVGGPEYREENTWFIFLIGLFIAGTIFASMAFNMLDSKDKGIYWLGLPATHAEKLVCTIFYTTVCFTVVYCICFFIVKYLAVLFIVEYIKDKPLFSYKEMGDYSKGFGEVLPYFLYAYFALQAFYLLGAVYFSRYTFVLTTVVGAIVIFAMAYYINRLDDAMFDKDGISWQLVSANKYNVQEKGKYHQYSLSPGIISVLKYFLQFAWAPLFWIISWYRLKEKEM